MTTRAWMLLGAAAIVGCSSPPAAAPAPTALSRPQGTGTAPLDVEIFGSHFDPVIRVTFGSNSQTTIDDAFTAYLQDDAAYQAGSPCPPAAPSCTPLDNVRFDTSERLVATIPAGLALGLYALVLVNPQGTAATLPGAFRVVTPVENVDRFRFDPLTMPDQRVNVPFEIGISAIDAQGKVVDGFTGAVDLRAALGAVTPTSIGPFTLGRARAQVTLGPPYRGGEVLVVDGTGPVAGKTGSSTSFQVLPRLAQGLAFTSPPRTLLVGGCAQLVLQPIEANGQLTQLTAAVQVDLSSGSEGLAFYDGASCTGPAVTQVPFLAYTASVTVSFSPAVAGPAPVRAQAPTLSTAIQNEVVN